MVKLHVPKNTQLPLDVKDDEVVIDTLMLQELADIAENYKSWPEMMAVLRNHVKDSHLQLRYPSLALRDMPPGTVGDALTAVLNVFGDVGMDEYDGKIPRGIGEPRLIAKLCGEMDTTERTAKQRLNTLKNGGYLKLESGLIMFPADKLARR